MESEHDVSQPGFQGEVVKGQLDALSTFLALPSLLLSLCYPPSICSYSPGVRAKEGKGLPCLSSLSLTGTRYRRDHLLQSPL